MKCLKRTDIKDKYLNSNKLVKKNCRKFSIISKRFPQVISIKSVSDKKSLLSSNKI